jgi:hypothetical protein
MRVVLVGPPVALAMDVFPDALAEVGRADDEDLEALRAGFVAPPRAGWDPHGVPLFDRDDLVVDLHPPAPVHDQVHLFLPLVCMPKWEPVAGRDALVSEGRVLELECLGGGPELELRRAVEHRADVLKILLEIPEGERHGATVPRVELGAGTGASAGHLLRAVRGITQGPPPALHRAEPEQAPALGVLRQPAKVAKVQWFPSGSAIVKSRDG